MLQKTIRLNRWTLTSITTLVALFAISTGCVSWKHHLNRDSRRAMVAAEHIGRVYHSPLCGQVLPDGHFIKCPACLQTPVYPEFAMLASDGPLEQQAMEAPSDVSNRDERSVEQVEQSDDLEEIVPPAPDSSEASVPTLPADIAMTEVTDASAVEPSQPADAVFAEVDLAQSRATARQRLQPVPRRSRPSWFHRNP